MEPSEEQLRLKNMEPVKPHSNRIPFIIGVMLVGVGLIVLLDQYIDTGWLALVSIPLAGIALLVEGYRSKIFAMLAVGVVLFMGGVGSLISFGFLLDYPWTTRIGLMLIVFAVGWLGIIAFSVGYSRRMAWWALVPGLVIAGVGAAFLFSPVRIYDFILYVSVSTGLALLMWGVFARLLGLLIPGSLLLGIGPGIYLAWGRSLESNSLAQTGIMLLSFALGFILIILSTRLVFERFIWWPLIPGGILAVVGWGLYIGGNPGNAANFIANTGSIGLIIFGLYLLLMRRGIQH